MLDRDEYLQKKARDRKQLLAGETDLERDKRLAEEEKNPKEAEQSIDESEYSEQSSIDDSDADFDLMVHDQPLIEEPLIEEPIKEEPVNKEPANKTVAALRKLVGENLEANGGSLEGFDYHLRHRKKK